MKPPERGGGGPGPGRLRTAEGSHTGKRWPEREARGLSEHEAPAHLLAARAPAARVPAAHIRPQPRLRPVLPG